MYHKPSYFTRLKKQVVNSLTYESVTNNSNISKYRRETWSCQVCFVNRSKNSVCFSLSGCTGFGWLSYIQVNRIWEFTISYNQMCVLEGSVDRHFLRFSFWIWKEIAPPALRKCPVDFNSPAKRAPRGYFSLGNTWHFIPTLNFKSTGSAPLAQLVL